MIEKEEALTPNEVEESNGGQNHDRQLCITQQNNIDDNNVDHGSSKMEHIVKSDDSETLEVLMPMIRSLMNLLMKMIQMVMFKIMKIVMSRMKLSFSHQ